jgi:type II secretory pathway pseudopilin PulG
MKISRPQPPAAFTMIEIAISLAVIGFALVAIIGVLPTGMNVQRQNREETIINQDAAVFANAIRNGARGLDDLTNYVYEVRRYTQEFGGKTNRIGVTVTNSYTYLGSTTTPVFPITNGYRIIGLLSWPKYEARGTSGRGGFASNYVVAFVRALSGPASEKPPQTNSEVRLDAFSYRMICENMPIAAYDGNTPHGHQLTNNLSELRLTFRWPLSATGVPGNGRQTFRAQVGGHLLATNDVGHALYFFEPQTFAQLPP